MRRLGVLLASWLVLLLMPPTQASGAPTDPRASLSVRDLVVEFVEGDRIRVRGQLRCQGLRQPEAEQAWSEIRVDIDLPDPARGFAPLPEEWWGEATEADSRGTVSVHWVHRGKRPRAKGAFMYTKALTAAPAVLDQHLHDTKDEGRWLSFDRTLDFSRIPAARRAQYRVVIGWTLHTMSGRFIHYYRWVQYGPFDWGKAPACDKTLVGRFRRPVSFTPRGVVTPAPIEPPAKDDAATEDGNQPPPVPKRSGKRPSQGEAVDKCTALDKTLTAWKQIARTQSRANPRRAIVSIEAEADVPAADLVALVARVAAQSAASLDWVQNVEVRLKGAQGSTTVTCAWDAIVAFAKKETTLQAFHATWAQEGNALPVPSKGD